MLDTETWACFVSIVSFEVAYLKQGQRTVALILKILKNIVII